ncbi:MAG: hypothetical protein WCE79_27420 [Xanthobacteraceae bacterium]
MDGLFRLQTTNANGYWVTSTNNWVNLTNDVNNRLILFDGSLGYLYAPGWQWGNKINDHVLDNWNKGAYWTDNSFFQKGVPIVYLPNGQIAFSGDHGQRLSLRGANNSFLTWVYWSFTANDPNTLYLTFKKAHLAAEEAKRMEANHPSALIPVETA